MAIHLPLNPVRTVKARVQLFTDCKSQVRQVACICYALRHYAIDEQIRRFESTDKSDMRAAKITEKSVTDILGYLNTKIVSGEYHGCAGHCHSLLHVSPCCPVFRKRASTNQFFLL